MPSYLLNMVNSSLLFFIKRNYLTKKIVVTRPPQGTPHLFNLTFMGMSVAYKIVMGSFPSHCTHLTQPLDDVPFASLKGNWQKGLLENNLHKVARKMSKADLFEVCTSAYHWSLTCANIQPGFRNYGIYPYNPSAQKLKFCHTSETTDSK